MGIERNIVIGFLLVGCTALILLYAVHVIQSYYSVFKEEDYTIEYTTFKISPDALANQEVKWQKNVPA